MRIYAAGFFPGHKHPTKSVNINFVTQTRHSSKTDDFLAAEKSSVHQQGRTGSGEIKKENPNILRAELVDNEKHKIVFESGSKQKLQPELSQLLAFRKKKMFSSF